LDKVNERSRLLERQKELEAAMKALGGARVIEEQELHAVKCRLQALNEAARMADGPARAARCSLADFAPRNAGTNP
jgi:hypothetical protein